MPDRLSALDTSFLHLERPTTPMHISSLGVYEGPAPLIDELRVALEQRLHLVPRFRQRLAMVPFNQHRPSWVDDPDFDLDAHLHAVRVPAPGGRLELESLSGVLLSTCLDRSRPLWDMYLIDGLPRGHFAILSKTHHALWDGVGGADLHTVLLDGEPDAPQHDAPDWRPAPPPTGAQLLADGVRSRVTEPLTAVARTVRRLPSRLRAAADETKQLLEGATAYAATSIAGAPTSPLNQKIGERRRYVTTGCRLSDLRDIGRAHGATVNDVLLAAVAGAVRAWFISRTIAPYDLRVMVPVSVRSPADRGAVGDRVAMVLVRLPVGEADPVRRLDRVHQQMQAAKRGGQVRASEVATQLGTYASPQAVSALTRFQSRRWFNLLVTNIPGPDFPLYLRGRRLLELYPQAPLSANQGLNVAAMSYNGSMGFGVLADPDTVSGLDVFVGALGDSISCLMRTVEIQSETEPIHDQAADTPPAGVLVGVGAADGEVTTS